MNPSDPEEARRLLLEELARGEYRQGDGFVGWLMGLVDRWWNSLVNSTDPSSAGGLTLTGITVALLLLAALLVVRRAGWLRRDASVQVSTALDEDHHVQPEELRRLAYDALQAERWDDAVVLALRGIVRDLHERTILDVPAGMTAQEAGTAITRAYPDLATPVTQTVTAFDTAAYSRRTVREKQAHDAVRLAEYIAETSPQWNEETAR